MSSRLRVLQVMDSLAVGGTETYVLSLIKTFPALGIQPSYAGAGGALYEAFARAGCPIHYVDLTAEQLLAPQWKEDTELALLQIMRHRRIDLVHVHQTPSGLYAAAAARRLGIPVVFTVHGAYYAPDQLRVMLDYGCAFVSVSVPVQAYLARQGIPSSLIANGVDFEHFHPAPSVELRESLGIPSHEPVIVYASRLAWDKAAVCALLIRAARSVRMEERLPLHVVVAGSGNQYGAIAELAGTANNDCGTTFIHMVGSKTHMRGYYGLGDLVVGTGRVALEAMACGKPVLAIGNHGYFGLVEKESYEEAWAYYFGDHASKQHPDEQLIATALRHAFTSPERLAELGRDARVWAMSQFNIHDKAAEMKELYVSLLSPASARRHNEGGVS